MDTQKLQELLSLIPDAIKWVKEQEAIILKTGSPLSGQDLADAKAVGVQFPEKIRMIQGVSIPVPSDPRLAQAAKDIDLITPDTDGMAFCYGIFVLKNCSNQRYIIAHECVHTAQYERLGGPERFLATYLQQCLDFGYKRAPLELEAIQTATALVHSKM